MLAEQRCRAGDPPRRLGQVDEVAELAEPPVRRVLVVGDEAGGDQIWLREPRASAVLRSDLDRYAGAIEQFERALRGQRSEEPTDEVAQCGRVGATPVGVREARIAFQAGYRLRERGPVRPAEARERDPAVSRLVQPVERAETRLVPIRAR